MRVDPEIVDSGSEQGGAIFETAEAAALLRGFRKDENAVPGQKRLFLDLHAISIVHPYCESTDYTGIPA